MISQRTITNAGRLGSANQRPAAPLAAVLPMHVAAALLGAAPRAFAKRVRKGDITGMVRSFDATGYVIGWRALDQVLATTLPAEDLELARLRLLEIRAGALRVVDGEFIPVEDYEPASTDPYLDEELEAELSDAYAALGGAVFAPEAFDRWGSENARDFDHRDVAVRLSAATWADAVRRVVSEEAAGSGAAAPSTDLNDPVTALMAAAATVGNRRGRGLTPKRFDDWAVETGSALRSGQLRHDFGGWNNVKRAAGLETDAPVARKR